MKVQRISLCSERFPSQLGMETGTVKGFQAQPYILACISLGQLKLPSGNGPFQSGHFLRN